MGWCHALGHLLNHERIKAARLVLKSLMGKIWLISSVLGKLFLMTPGMVHEASLRRICPVIFKLTYPGPPLHSVLKLGLDSGLMVFVPEKRGNTIEWKIMLKIKQSKGYHNSTCGNCS